MVPEACFALRFARKSRAYRLHITIRYLSVGPGNEAHAIVNIGRMLRNVQPCAASYKLSPCTSVNYLLFLSSYTPCVVDSAALKYDYNGQLSARACS